MFVHPACIYMLKAAQESFQPYLATNVLLGRLLRLDQSMAEGYNESPAQNRACQTAAKTILVHAFEIVGLELRLCEYSTLMR